VGLLRRRWQAVRSLLSRRSAKGPAPVREVGTQVWKIDDTDLRTEEVVRDLLRRSPSAGKRDRWVAVWCPLAASGRPRSERLWVRRDDDGLLRLIPGGSEGPRDSAAPVFYVNGSRAYRDEGHPDGPSSVPYYVVTHRSVRPAEGHPGGADDRIHWEIKTPAEVRGR